MRAMSFSDQPLPSPTSGDVASLLSACREKFNEILSNVLQGQDQEAHRVEASIFKHLMELGFLLLNVFFSTHHLGDYGPTLETGEGTAERGRPSEKSYFSIFGKLNVKRYLYHLGADRFAPLDIVLNLPIRCYSYFLSEWVNQLTLHRAYEHTSAFLKKFLGLELSVSALETISQESATQYEAYYAGKKTLPKAEPTGAWTVVSFDGKGVPMINPCLEDSSVGHVRKFKIFNTRENPSQEGLANSLVCQHLEVKQAGRLRPMSSWGFRAGLGEILT